MAKIVHLQTLVSYHGNAPYRLHKSMLSSGLDSKMIVYTTPRAANDNFFRFSGIFKLIKSQLYNQFQKYIIKKKNPLTYLFSHPKFIGNSVHNHPFVQQADVIYLHWIVGGFLSFKGIENIFKLGKPVVFFMHDMWAFTGGCHHSFDCDRYKIDCLNCPLFKGEKAISLASKQFEIKKELFSKYSNVYFISPSNWMMNCAKESGVLQGKLVFNIPNIIDEKLFKEFDSKVAKRIIGIDENMLTISFGCVAGKNNPFKGWEYLEEALKLLKNDNKHLLLNVLVFGSDYDQDTVNRIPFPIKFMGDINDELTMVVLNNASDLFVSPSLAESFGQTFLENLLCGTPVVGFNVGPISEIIEHKVNGYLAKYKSSSDLAEGILYCITNNLQFKNPSQFFSDKTIKNHLKVIETIFKQ